MIRMEYDGILGNMMNINPSIRYGLQECLGHSWFEGVLSEEAPVEPEPAPLAEPELDIDGEMSVLDTAHAAQQARVAKLETMQPPAKLQKTK